MEPQLAILMIQANDVAGVFQALFIIIAVAIFYFLPAAAAWKKRDFGAIFALNFFLGWTLIGWVIALCWALKRDAQNRVIIQAPQGFVAPGPPIFCVSCGRYSLPNSTFCVSCGARMRVQAGA